MSPDPRSKANVPALSLRKLQKTYHVGFGRRRVTALQDATFDVPQGCVFGLVGPNGAGKTTTIKILMGLIRASSGEAHILGHRVPGVASRRPVGFLPETPHFYDHLRPTEFLMYVGRLHRMSRRQSAHRVDELLERVGLDDHRRKPIRKFSKGMVQRLGIAQTLMHDPEIVILDEPQSGLDPIGRKEVKDIIVELGKKGRTVFFSSHILSDVEAVSDEVAVMMRGRVRDVGRVDMLLNPRVVEIEIEVAGIDDSLATALRERAARSLELEHSLLLSFEGHVAIDAVVQQVVSAGGTIQRLVSHREDLEDLFVREAQIVEAER